MYARNPLMIAGASHHQNRNRRRQSIGAEFKQCNGYWIKGDQQCPPSTPGTHPGGWGNVNIPVLGPPDLPPPANYNPPTTPTYYPPPQVTIPTYSPPPGNPPNIGPPLAPPNGCCAPPVNVCPENQKRYVMPFVPDAGYTSTVTAGSQVRFVGKPQKLFSPDRLIIASTIAPYFDVVNLIIGNIPQSLSQGNVAADMFSEVATYVMMTFDQAYPGIDVIIIAQNKSSVTQTFQAQLVGEAVG